MSNRGSSYENLYTKQINDAVFDQTGYDSKKVEEKKRIQKENEYTRRNIRAILGLVVVCFMAGAAYFISLDPANAGPTGIAFCVFLAIGGLIWFMNR